MTARPILFSGDMVRALLDGRKTQTRRICRPQPGDSPRDEGYLSDVVARCPYGKPGDLLWVREAWFEEYDDNSARPFTPPRAIYRATEQNEVRFMDDDGFTAFNRDGTMKSPWRPSIHMPRWASRLTLRITDVRVQRVQEISEEDAMAEGINRIPHGREGDYFHHSRTVSDPHNWCHPDDAFREQWDDLNAARGYGWEANPWVWVLTFEVISANVDSVDPVARPVELGP